MKKAEASLGLIIGIIAVVGLVAYGTVFSTGGWTWQGQIAPTSGCWMRSTFECQGDTEHTDASKVIIGDHILVSREGRGFDPISPGAGYDACEVEVQVYIDNVKQGHALVYGDYINSPFGYAAGTPYGSCRLDNSNIRVDDRRVDSWRNDDGFMLIEFVTFFDFNPNENPPDEEFKCSSAEACVTYCSENQCNTPICDGEWTCIKPEGQFGTVGECMFDCYDIEDVECYNDANCPMGYICHENECIPAMDPLEDCYTNADCIAGYICNLGNNLCEEEQDSGSTIPAGTIPGIPAGSEWIVVLAIIALIGGTVLIGSKSKQELSISGRLYHSHYSMTQI